MILDLNQARFLGRGRTKSCYEHPLDATKCIKLVTNPKANPRELQKELRELTRVNDWAHPRVLIPKYYGEALTNLGVGYVFDRVISPAGEAYPTLRLFLETSEVSAEQVATLLESLSQVLGESGILFSELNVDNVFLLHSEASSEKRQFAIVDGFGEGSAIRLGEFIPFFAASKVQRKFQALRQEVNGILTRKRKVQ